jgi:hypothetical protein
MGYFVFNCVARTNGNSIKKIADDYWKMWNMPHWPTVLVALTGNI